MKNNSTFHLGVTGKTGCTVELVLLTTTKEINLDLSIPLLGGRSSLGLKIQDLVSSRIQVRFLDLSLAAHRVSTGARETYLITQMSV